MKASEIIAVLEANRETILEALKEADRAAYRHTSCKYSVAVFADGHTEQREYLAGDNWWYENDPAVAEIGNFCYQYGGAFEVVPQSELVRDLIRECTPEELEAYHRYLAAYQRAQRDLYEDEDEYAPEEYDIINWFRENSPAYDRLLEYTIKEITDQAVPDGYYDALIDQAESDLADLEKYGED